MTEFDPYHESQRPTIDQLVASSEAKLAGGDPILGRGWSVEQSRRNIFWRPGPKIYKSPDMPSPPEDPEELVKYLNRYGQSRHLYWTDLGIRNHGGQVTLGAFQAVEQQTEDAAPDPVGDVLYRLVVEMYSSDGSGPLIPFELFVYSLSSGIIVYEPSKALGDTLDSAKDSPNGQMFDIFYEQDPLSRALAYVDGRPRDVQMPSQ